MLDNRNKPRIEEYVYQHYLDKETIAKALNVLVDDIESIEIICYRNYDKYKILLKT